MSLRNNKNTAETSKQNEGLLAKWLPKNPSIRIITIIVTVAALWMLTGVFNHKNHNTAESIVVPKVSIVESHSQEKSITFDLNGVTKADKMVILRPEIDGAITHVIARNGEFLKKDSPVVTIDIENRKKNFEASKANLESNKILLQSAESLYKKKLSSENAYLQAKTNFRTAEATYEAALSEYEKTTVRAPFDGYIDLIKVNQGDYVSTMLSSQIANFNYLNPIKAVADVAQNKVSILSDKSSVTVKSFNGIERKGNLSFISNTADPATRTYYVEIDLPNEDGAFKIGESVTVMFSTDTKYKMHYIAKSALVLNDQGAISVRLINDDYIVETHQIEILDEDENGFWVMGLKDSVKVIYVGNAFVKDGEKVETS